MRLFRICAYSEHINIFVLKYGFANCILVHRPLYWKYAGADLDVRQSPTLNDMKPYQNKTHASRSFTSNCRCNLARSWILPLLGQQGRVRLHYVSLGLFPGAQRIMQPTTHPMRNTCLEHTTAAAAACGGSGPNMCAFHK